MLVLAFERDESDRRRRRASRPARAVSTSRAAKSSSSSAAAPRRLLFLVVVVAGEFLDAQPEDVRQHRRIGRQIRPQRERAGWRLRAHRAISQVVPSLESFSTTPSAASSSRMRSDSAKFFAPCALQAARAIRAGFRLRKFSARARGAFSTLRRQSRRKPKNASVPASDLWPARLRSACISAIALRRVEIVRQRFDDGRRRTRIGLVGRCIEPRGQRLFGFVETLQSS